MLQWQTTHTTYWMLNAILKCRNLTQNSNAWVKANQRGIYCTVSIYRETQGDRTEVPWKRIFFQNSARPRACFILWLAFLGRLPTKDRLVKMGLINDLSCCFCQQVETLQHMFFDCEFTMKIWHVMLCWNVYTRNPEPWSSEKIWLIQENSKKRWRREILRMNLTEVVYHILQLRNDCVFNHTQPFDNSNMTKECIVGIWKFQSHLNVSDLCLLRA